MVTINETGNSVSLTGSDVVVNLPGTPISPPTTRISKAATQADLRWIFENGNPLLEEVDVPQPTAVK